MPAPVRIENDARGVARITMSRPDVRNAFDADLIAALTARTREVPADARVVVLASEGETFSAGADLRWMRATVEASRDQNVTDSRALAMMYAALDDLPMPLVVRVQGAAVGGGAGLVAMGDIVVASENATFAFTETRLGILPSVVSPYVVRKLGPAFATAAFVTGIRFDAHRAFEVGLVTSVEHGEGLDAEVEEFVEAILACGPAAARGAKRLVRDVVGRRPEEVRELTIERIADARVSVEGQEGMRAFLEKRAPRWQQ